MTVSSLHNKTHSISRKQLWRRRATVAIVFLVVWLFVAWRLARWLIVHDSLPRADAILVLSGSATNIERAQRAATLYNEGRARKIILTNDNVQTGWSQEEQANLFYFEHSQQILRRFGVPQESIEVIRSPVFSTHDEAVLLKDYSARHGLSSLLVVTSAYHSRRALWTFRQVFQGSNTQVGVEPVDTGFQTPAPSTWWLHLRGWELVPTEYLKLVVYWYRFRPGPA